MTADLLIRAWTQISRDWVLTAQIVLVLWVFTQIPFLLIDYLYYGALLPDWSSPDLPLAHWSCHFAQIGVVAVLVFCWVWIAVAWHRLTLLGERPSGILPPFHRKELGRYVPASVAVFMIGFLCALPFVFAGLVWDDYNWNYEDDTQVYPAGVTLLTTTILIFVTNYVGFRLGLILPAIALGGRMKFSRSLTLTRPIRGTLLALSAILSICAFPTIWLSLAAPSNLIVHVLSYAFEDALLFFGLCLLTLVYSDLVPSERHPDA